MKRLMTTILAAACGVACVAQEAPAPAKPPAKAPASAPAQRVERRQHMRMDHSQRMMRGMRGGIETRSFGKLADGKEAKIYRLKGMGGLILDITDFGGRTATSRT